MVVRPLNHIAHRARTVSPYFDTQEDSMADSNQHADRVKPSEQGGGTALNDKEAHEKGSWVGTAGEGIVPAGLGGSDAPREMRDRRRS
jgi:hypothetical protein